MENTFDKKQLISNISYLINTNNIKIGEIEKEIGVSTGYISRIQKEDGPMPNIEFINSISKKFNVSIDTLLNINMSQIISAENYILNLLDKLINDTEQDSLNWNIETTENLHKNSVISNHSLFEESIISDRKYIFDSMMYSLKTEIHGTCFNLEMKNHSKLYVMNIIDEERSLLKNAENILNLEIWLVKDYNKKEFICNTKNSNYTQKLIYLYNSLIKNMSKPKLNKDTKYIFDSYLIDNDLSNDEDELPF